MRFGIPVNNEFKWLISLSIISGFIGWAAYGYITKEVIYWSLPIYCLLALIFTVNGDHIIEAIIVLLLFGGLAFLLNSLIAERYGFAGLIPSVYIALALSKLSFAFAKSGLFGNNKFT